MSVAAIVGTAIVSFVVGAYCEYRAGRADAKAQEAATLRRIIAKEESVLAEIKGRVATILAEVKAWEAAAAKVPGEVIEQVAARIKQIL